MDEIKQAAQASLSDGPETGVAPPSGSSEVIPPIIDEKCLWVGVHKQGWQEGEQGVIDAIIAHLFPHIPEENRWCVEFGAGDSMSLPLTSAYVLSNYGWRALLIEPDDLCRRRLKRKVNEELVVILDAKVTPHGETSIDALMESSGCPKNPAVMVVDIDSIDYYVVEAMASRPMVLCVETLDRFSPKDKPEPYVPAIEECGVVIDDGFDTQIQANGAAFDELMLARQYKLVFRTRYNSIYVRDDMIPRLRKNMLNLGCGTHNYPGYEPVDMRINGKDVRKLEHANSSQDEVYASHVLEHLPVREVDAILAEWVRVLKPGGTLKLAVPDMRKIAAKLAVKNEAADDMYLLAMIYGSQDYETNFHQWGYTEEVLRTAMYAAGIGFVKPWQAFIPDCCSHNPCSLNLEGQKRWFPKLENPKVCLVLCQPRITFSGHEKSLVDFANKFKFDIQPSMGAFWDRDMACATKAAIERFDPDILLFSDYDSVFEPSDVELLLKELNDDPTLAAIGPVQMSRHDDRPLVHDTGLDYSKDTTKVRYSHFGLTAIRREVFNELPKPWFWTIPGKDKNGDWDWDAWGRTDADITFWRVLDTMGFNVRQHNKVCIGHIIQSIKYPSVKGRGVMLTPIENYWRGGKPKDVGLNAELFKPKPPAPPATSEDKK